jgi:hypothetical protein
MKPQVYQGNLPVAGVVSRTAGALHQSAVLKAWKGSAANVGRGLRARLLPPLCA